MAATQPKKPVGGAFGQFCNERRAEFAKKCEGKPVTEVTKLLSAEWKTQTDAQKAPYEKKYKDAKAKFDADMEAFKAGGGEVQPRKAKAKAKGEKKKKDPDAPKKPVGGAYGIFMNENRDKFQKSLPAGSAASGVSKLASQKWKELSDEAKAPFEKKYQAAAAAYKKAMEEYKAKGGGGDEEEEDDEEPLAKKAKK